MRMQNAESIKEQNTEQQVKFHEPPRDYFLSRERAWLARERDVKAYPAISHIQP